MGWLLLLVVIGWITSIFTGSQNSKDDKPRSKRSRKLTDTEDSANASAHREAQLRLIEAEHELRRMAEDLGLFEPFEDTPKKQPSPDVTHPTSTTPSATARPSLSATSKTTAIPAPVGANKTGDPLDANLQTSDVEDALRQHGVTSLWHMTHYQNIASIMQSGLISHTSILKTGTVRNDISDESVQKHREATDPFYQRKIHDYVPLYIAPRNPMLYKLRNQQREICFIEICTSVLSEMQFLLTDGNAAAHRTRFLSDARDVPLLPWDVLHADYWGDFPDGKRKKCAEVLIFPRIYVRHFKSIRFSSTIARPTVLAQRVKLLSADEFYF